MCVTLAWMQQLEPISPLATTHTVKHAINMPWLCVHVCVCMQVCVCVCVYRYSPASRPNRCRGALAACSGSSSCCFVVQVNSISNTVLPVKQLGRKLSLPFSLINKQCQPSRNEDQSPESMLYNSSFFSISDIHPDCRTR